MAAGHQHGDRLAEGAAGDAIEGVDRVQMLALLALMAIGAVAQRDLAQAIDLAREYGALTADEARAIGATCGGMRVCSVIRAMRRSMCRG